MENKLFSSTLAKKKELKTYLVLFWDNAEYLGLYLACPKAESLHLNLEFVNIFFTYLSFTKKFELPKYSCNSLNLKLLNVFFKF